MKRIITFCAALLMSASLFAQAPEKMSYQAVVRDGSNALVTSAAVGMKISILQGSVSGTAVYVETQTPTSNANGLVSVEIGGGTIVSGAFASIDWENGPYFIKTETDPTGGTNYTVTGTSQLLSVPYALYAKESGRTYQIGDFAHGGIVFWVDESGKHGLVVAKTDQNGGAYGSWTTGATLYNTMAYANGPGAGKSNTAIIIAVQGFGNGDPYAARMCNELLITEGGISYADWYLPSIDELQLLYDNQSVINATAVTNGGTDFNTSLGYWSSTETDVQYVNALNFSNGIIFLDAGKNNSGYIRAVRSF